MNEKLRKIEKRMAEIKSLMNEDGADIDALTAEVDTLIEERKKILEGIQKRSILLSRISSGEMGEGTPVTPVDGEERGMDASSKEYRSAFLKQIRGMELSDIEQRAITTADSSAGAAVPTQTLNKIIEKVHQYAPLLDKIEMLSIKGNVTIPAEGTTIDANLHAEGAAITGDDDTLNKIDLGMYEITKLVTISKSVETMSIDAFENWLTKKIAKKIAAKITGYILNGTGTGQPQGINAIKWDNNNSVTVAANASLTEANIDSVVGLLPGGYDPEAEWYMSKKTFFADFRPLQNKSKNDLVTKENGTWYVAGYPVNFDERIALHEAILGDAANGYTGNMPENVTIVSQFVVRENSYDYLGTAMFDGKVSAVEAFVKVCKAAAAS